MIVRCSQILMIALILCGVSLAHTVDYQVDRENAVVVTVRLGDEEASYSEYEIFPPSTSETPFQLGRTDAKGRLTFIPTEPGVWRVKVSADSQHGLHGAEIEVKVDEGMTTEIASRPLVARHTRLVVGISILFGLFGLMSLLKSKKS